MDTYGVDLMGRRRRRRHSAEFKAAVIQECMTPGVSIAAVALAHSLNANMLRKWVIDAEQAGIPAPPVRAAPEQARLPPPSFIPLALKAPSVEGDIRIELQRSGTTVNVVWPVAAAAECAAWLRDWLR
jgi:transposase